MKVTKNLFIKAVAYTMLSTGFHSERFGMYCFFRIAKERCVLFPTVELQWTRGEDSYYEFEIRMLCFGIGTRFILRKKK